MKRIIGLLMFAAICLVAHGEQIFKTLSSGNGVEKVFIGKTLLRMGGALGGVSDMSVGDPTRLDSLEVVTIDSKRDCKDAMSLLDAYVKAHDLEILLEKEEDGEVTKIYGELMPDGLTLKTMIIYTKDGWEMKVVVLSGQISPESISGF